MATVYWRGEILVRRKGAVTSINFKGSDLVTHDVFTGDRWARQISRRHWIRKETSCVSSNESCCGTDITTKLPHMKEPTVIGAGIRVKS